MFLQVGLFIHSRCSSNLFSQVTYQQEVLSVRIVQNSLLSGRQLAQKVLQGSLNGLNVLLLAQLLFKDINSLLAIGSSLNLRVAPILHFLQFRKEGLDLLAEIPQQLVRIINLLLLSDHCRLDGNRRSQGGLLIS